MERFRQSERSVEALQKEISEQSVSYIGIIDEKDDTIAKVRSLFGNCMFSSPPVFPFSTIVISPF